MKLAIPEWEHRVSPVLDVAGSLRVVCIEDGRVAWRCQVPVREPGALLQTLHEYAVETVICCAVSRQLEMAIEAAGICLMPHICGVVDEVLIGYLRRQLENEAFRMPGCCRRRQGTCRESSDAAGGDAPPRPARRRTRRAAREMKGTQS